MSENTVNQGTNTVNQGTDNIKEPQAKYNRLQRIGLSLAAIFAAAVCVYICGNKVFDNKLIITIFSITAILFAIIFYFIYKYNISTSDSIVEDYMKDKELYRQLKRRKSEMESNEFVKKNEFNNLKSQFENIKNQIENDLIKSEEFQNNVASKVSKSSEVTEQLKNIASNIKNSTETANPIKVNVNLNDVTKKEVIEQLKKVIDEINNKLNASSSNA